MIEYASDVRYTWKDVVPQVPFRIEDRFDLIVNRRVKPRCVVRVSDRVAGNNKLLDLTIGQKPQIIRHIASIR